MKSSNEKNKKYHNVETIREANIKFAEKDMTSHFPGLVQRTSIKSGEEKLVLWAQTVKEEQFVTLKKNHN